MSKADELLVVVDEHDQLLEPMPRGSVHGANIWHRVAHIWVVNGRGEILCQQRSLHKDLNPGYWDAIFGGHLAPGEEYREAAVREVHEELGLEVQASDLRLWRVYKFEGPGNYEFQAVFVLKWDGTVDEVRFNDGEVQQVAWVPRREVARHALEPMDGWVHIGYEKQLFEDLGWLQV